MAEGRSRNSSSDIFSLGCVYLEIVDSLYAGIIEEDLLAGPFHEKLFMMRYRGWARANKDCGPILRLLDGLLARDATDRPSAVQIVFQGLDLSVKQPRQPYICQQCFHESTSSSQIMN